MTKSEAMLKARQAAARPFIEEALRDLANALNRELHDMMWTYPDEMEEVPHVRAYEVEDAIARLMSEGGIEPKPNHEA